MVQDKEFDKASQIAARIKEQIEFAADETDVGRKYHLEQAMGSISDLLRAIDYRITFKAQWPRARR